MAKLQIGGVEWPILRGVKCQFLVRDVVRYVFPTETGADKQEEEPPGNNKPDQQHKYPRGKTDQGCCFSCFEPMILQIEQVDKILGKGPL